MNELMKKRGTAQLSLNDINEITAGRWKNVTTTEDEINAAKKLAANGGQLAKEFDRIGGVNGSLTSSELDPEINKPRNATIGTDKAQVYHFQQEFIDPSSQTNIFNAAVNSIKFLAEANNMEYINKVDVQRAIERETDPGRKQIYEWIFRDFDNIDGTKNKDGVIGAGDLEKWFNWTK